MRNLSLIVVFECVLLCVLVLDLDDVFVSAQASTGFDFSSILKQMVPHVPGKIIGLIQLSLLSRLLRQRRNRLGVDAGSNGIDDDRDGQVDESDEMGLDVGNKKNVMIFMGKHNIQVSNHGIKNDEEDEEEDDCDDCGDDDDEDDDDDDDEDEDEDNGKDKYTKGNSYGDDDDEDDDYTTKSPKKKSKKSQKSSKKSKTSSNGYEDNNSGYGGDDSTGGYSQYSPYTPGMMSFATNTKQTRFPWFKKMFATNEQSNGKSVANEGDNGIKDMGHIMASPNGFPIGGSKLENFDRSDSTDDKDNQYLDTIEDMLTYEPSESEINELLKHPEVMEFLNKLNGSQDIEKEVKRSKRETNFDKSNQSLTSDESQRSQHFVPISSLSGYGFRTNRNYSNLLQNYVKSSSAYPSVYPLNGQKSVTIPVNRDFIKALKSHSNFKSLNHNFEPQESLKSVKSGDYFSFKPLSSKPKANLMSSSMNQPSYGQMETTDDNQYDNNDMSGMTGSGDSYGMNEMSDNSYGGMSGGNSYGGMSGGSSGGYGGSGGYGAMGGGSGGYGGSDLPLMDLSYWSKIMNKSKPKKKKYTTTQSPTTTADYNDDDDDDDEEDEEDVEEEDEPKKTHTTIQVIKAGSKTGNLGINNGCTDDCEEDSRRGLRAWMRRLPGFGRFGG